MTQEQVTQAESTDVQQDTQTVAVAAGVEINGDPGHFKTADIGNEPVDHLPPYLQEAFNEAGVELKNERLERLAAEEARKAEIIEHFKTKSVLYKMYGQNILNMLTVDGAFSFHIPVVSISMLKEQIDVEQRMYNSMPLSMFGPNNTFVEIPGVKMPISVNSLTKRIADLRVALDHLVDKGDCQRADKPLRLEVSTAEGYVSKNFIQPGEHNGPVLMIGEIQHWANLRNHLLETLTHQHMQARRAEKEAQQAALATEAGAPDVSAVVSLDQAMNPIVPQGEGVTAEEMAAQLVQPQKAAE